MTGLAKSVSRTKSWGDFRFTPRIFWTILLAVWSLFHGVAAFTKVPTHADAVNPYVVVSIPFWPTQADLFYRPHQLIIVGLARAGVSPTSNAVFIFDTGSQQSAISATLARNLGLPMQQQTSKNRQLFVDSDGKSTTNVTVPRLDVGSLNVSDFPLNIVPDEKLSQTLGQPVDGILGANFWQSFVVHLDFASQKLTFIAPSASLRYSALGSPSVDLPSTEIRRLGFSDALTVPLLPRINGWLASFHFSNSNHTAAQMLLIDTGSGATILSQPVAQQLVLEPIVKGKYAAFTPFETALSWLPKCWGSGLTLTSLLVEAPTKYEAGFSPRLGLDILANYDILFDFPHQKMYLKPRTDLQALTYRQYVKATSAQRKQWAQGRPIITFPTLDCFAIPYEINGSGLPVTQARQEPGGPPVSFLLKTTMTGSSITQSLATRWGLTPKPWVQRDGTPVTFEGQPLSRVTVPQLCTGGAQWNFPLVVLSPALALQASFGSSVEGALGGNTLLSASLLMDPQTQTWMRFAPNIPLEPEDLKSIEMSEASVLDLLDPDNDGTPACTVEARQGDQRHTETLSLATGSPFTLLSAEAARALKLTPEPKKLEYRAGTALATFNQARVSQLVVGKVVLTDFLIAYPEGTMPEGFSPRLGMDVLSRLRLLIDTPGKKLYVQAAASAK